MPRDWDGEWGQLSHAQDEALQARREAYACLFQVFSRSGAPSDEELGAAEDENERVDQAQRIIDAFLDDWRRSQG